MWTDREVSRSQELGPGWALCLPSRPWAVLPSCFLRLSASGCMRRGPGAPQTPRLIWVLVSVVVKNPPPSAGGARDSGSIRGSGRTPGRGNGNPLQYSCPGKSHRQRGLAGYSPWDHKELDTTEHNTAHFLLQLLLPASHQELHFANHLPEFRDTESEG